MLRRMACHGLRAVRSSGQRWHSGTLPCGAAAAALAPQLQQSRWGDSAFSRSAAAVVGSVGAVVLAGAGVALAEAKQESAASLSHCDYDFDELHGFSWGAQAKRLFAQLEEEGYTLMTVSV